jgi:hypothetical protein
MITFDGLTADEILSLPDDLLNGRVVSGAPLVVRVGTADVLCRFWIDQASLVLELGHIDGGGEGVLPAIAVLAQRFATRRGLQSLDWRVHAITCKEPNLKLRRLLMRRGFAVSDVPGTGVCYQLIQAIQSEREEPSGTVRERV